MMFWAEVATILPMPRMVTEIVQGDTTLFKEETREETVNMRFLCQAEPFGRWRCGMCWAGVITVHDNRCPVCHNEVDFCVR